MSYQLIKNYKTDDVKRTSFNALAQKTFGINFEPWYQMGFWTDAYQTYTLFDGETAVSNVSYNIITLIKEEKHIPAIQIGTVMTSEAYRRQGLAKKLLNQVIKDLEGRYDFFFLAADQLAIPLYKSCGFVEVQESTFTLKVNGHLKPLSPISMSPDKLLHLKNLSKPLSTYLSCTDDIHVLMFYYTMGFENMFYQPLPDLVVIYEIEDKSLFLYDIITPLKLDHMSVVNAIMQEGVEEIRFMFTPDSSVKNVVVSSNDSNNWMVRSANKSFPNTFTFPSISQT